MRFENRSDRLPGPSKNGLAAGAVAAFILAFGVAGAARAATLTVDLPDAPAVQRHVAHFQCDAAAAAFGLPAGAFAVEYLNSGENSLAVLPIHGRKLIFAGVISGSGARYAAGRYIWWDAAGRAVSLSDVTAPDSRANCHPAGAK